MQTLEKFKATGKVEDGEVYLDADPNAPPSDGGAPHKFNFLPNPAVGNTQADYDKARMWGSLHQGTSATSDRFGHVPAPSPTRTMLRMKNIAKCYGAAVALESADFEVSAGEVMALLGENGAGKSTLVKILAGLEQPDQGSIEIDGQPRQFRSPGQSRAAGVAYVAQELSILGDLSIAENVFLGDTAGVWRSVRGLADRAAPFLQRVGLDQVDALQPAGELSVAERQLVEIARLLSRNARIAILDEPTAAPFRCGNCPRQGAPYGPLAAEGLRDRLRHPTGSAKCLSSASASRSSATAAPSRPCGRPISTSMD